MNKITQVFFRAKSKTTIKELLVLFALLLMNTQVSWGQLNISAGTTITENFDGIGSTANAALPAGWKIENVTGARNVVTAYSSVANTATNQALAYNSAMSTTAANGRYNFGGSSATDRAIGGISSGSASQTVNMFLQLTNNGSSVIKDFTMNYDVERYRNGTNATGFSIRVYYSTTGLASSWTELTSFVATFSGANADNNGSITNPIQTVNITNKTINQSLDIGSSIYLAWSYSVTSGTTTSNAQALGIDNISITANAPTNTTWNGSSWTYGTPTASIDAIIDGTYNTKPVIEGGNGSFTAKKLTVNSGKSLTINSGTNVTVQNDIINNGTLTVESNANLLQDPATVVNTNIGAITVKRDSNPLKRLDYTLWSSPVTGTQTLAAFSPETSQSPSRFYTYNPGTNLYDAIDATSTSFSAGTGYLIRMPNTADTVTPAVYPGAFTGTPNNGNVSITTATSGYYAVGNPYPSTIDANAFLTLPGNTTDGTLYFWRKTNGVANIAGSSATGTAYATWTTLGAAASDVAPNNVVPNGTIQVGQGFIVKSNGSSLTFTNAMRLGTVSTQFFKTKQQAEKSRIWLNLTNTSGVFSQALVGYVDGATMGVDAGIDGKYINDSAIALTSNINNEEYTIQGRPAFDAGDIVALNFKTDLAGDYSIAIDHVDGLFAAGQDIYLVDSQTGAEINLKEGAYNFTANAGIDNSRFSLKYQKTLKINAAALNDNNVQVYKNNGTLYVNSTSKAIRSIQVYDVQGRLLAEQKNVKSNAASISNLRVEYQVLVVRVTGEDNSEVTKKVAN